MEKSALYAVSSTLTPGFLQLVLGCSKYLAPFNPCSESASLCAVVSVACDAHLPRLPSERSKHSLVLSLRLPPASWLNLRAGMNALLRSPWLAALRGQGSSGLVEFFQLRPRVGGGTRRSHRLTQLSWLAGRWSESIHTHRRAYKQVCVHMHTDLYMCMLTGVYNTHIYIHLLVYCTHMLIQIHTCLLYVCTCT